MASVKDLTPHGINIQNCRLIGEDDYRRLVRQQCQPLVGDVLIAKDGNSALDTVCEIRTPLELVLLSSVAILRPNPSRISSSFLRYYLDCDSTRKYLKGGFITGAAIPRVIVKDFKRAKIAVPPLPTQRKIAAILSAYDDLIENNTRRIAILEEMAQAIYREWFVNFRFPGHEKVKLIDSPLGKIPEGWKVLPLGELAEITMGTSPKGDTYNEDGIGTPLVNGPVEFAERFTKRVKWTTAPNKMSKSKDLIVCVRGSTTGKYVKCDGEYCLGRGVCSIRSNHQSFVDLLFRSELPKLLGQTGGSTFPSWTAPQLKGHPVLSPPTAVLDTFEAIVSPMNEAVFVCSRKNLILRKTRDLLLPKLISGQLDVDELDIDIGESLMETEA